MATQAWLLIALMLITGSVSTGWAQAPGVTDADRHFRVEWEPRETKRGHVVAGHIDNDSSLDAERIRLRVQGVDAQGNVVSTTLEWVLGTVSPFNCRYFEVKVPGRAATYRISVLSVDWGCAGAGGGM